MYIELKITHKLSSAAADAAHYFRSFASRAFLCHSIALANHFLRVNLIDVLRELFFPSIHRSAESHSAAIPPIKSANM